MSNQNLLNIVQPLVNLLKMEENGEEKEKIIEKSLKSFFENIKIFKDDIEHTKKEQDQEIEFHAGFIKILESLPQNSKIKELKQKEAELVDLLKKEGSWLENTYLSITFLENIISFLEKKNKLQKEIDILAEDLRTKGIIK